MKVRIYQICYSQETLASIPEGFLPLNNVANERSDWRELWPIRNYNTIPKIDENPHQQMVLYEYFSKL